MNWYKKAKKECTGWLAIRLPQKEAQQIQKWGKENISDNILNKEDGHGRETDTHITIAYGICAEDVEIIKTIFKKKKKIKATLRDVGFFKPDGDYEPVIIKVESKDLEELNEEISRTLYIESTYDEFKPHCTVAYVKKGEALKFAGNKIFNGIELMLNKIVFVNNDNKEIEISL
jgi:2'-5' RNA ligase